MKKSFLTTITVALALMFAACEKRTEKEQELKNENPAATQNQGTIKPAPGGPDSADPGPKK